MVTKWLLGSFSKELTYFFLYSDMLYEVKISNDFQGRSKDFQGKYKDLLGNISNTGKS